MPHMSKDHEPWATNDGNHIMVPNLNEMISTIVTMTRVSVWVLKPLGVDERLDPQHGEAQCQV